MKKLVSSLLAATALAVTAMIASQAGVAQAPAGAPAGATGLCNDGSYWTGASKSGACRGHKGVKTWYAGGSSTPAPGGGPGMVWLNTSTKVYHCYGTKYYGTTKAGAYMTEADAKAKGAHADAG